MPSGSALIGSLLFGAIGYAAFSYGKKSASTRPIVFGVALMVFPYFVTRTWLMYMVGSALCLALYMLRG